MKLEYLCAAVFFQPSHHQELEKTDGGAYLHALSILSRTSELEALGA